MFPMSTLRSCRRWYQATLLLTRTPLIKFPIRRTADGQILVTLSDKLLTNTTHKAGPVVELPANYGRALPISEEEIASINLGGAR